MEKCEGVWKTQYLHIPAPMSSLIPLMHLGTHYHDSIAQSTVGHQG